MTVGVKSFGWEALSISETFSISIKEYNSFKRHYAGKNFSKNPYFLQFNKEFMENHSMGKQEFYYMFYLLRIYAEIKNCF